MTTTPIIMTKEYWQNSQLSIATYYGGLKFNGKEYKIVNKHGITLEELSNPMSKYWSGNGEYAIPPGEPADLVQEDWLPVYRSLGREKTFKLIKKNVPLSIAKKQIKTKK